MKKEKIKIVIICSLFGTLLSLSPIFAAVQFPEFKGTNAAEYIVYLFNLAIMIGAFLAGGVLCWAGIEYVSAYGNPVKLESARNKVKNTFLGLIILLASFMILNIINPQLTSVKIDQTKDNATKSEVAIPEGKGVFLYDSPDFISTNTKEPLKITETMPTFSDADFNSKIESIKFNNPSGYQFGAILFANRKQSKDEKDSALGSGADLRGDCSYTLSDISDLNNANGKENNPPIGRDNLSSILLFKTTGYYSGEITIYNTIDCKERPDDYSVQCKDENICKINFTGSEFKNLKDLCPGFVGEIMSIQASAKVGILFKATTATLSGRCQFVEMVNPGCINTLQYSYVYKMNDKECSPTVTPKSFVIFSLVK